MHRKSPRRPNDLEPDVQPIPLDDNNDINKNLRKANTTSSALLEINVSHTYGKGKSSTQKCRLEGDMLVFLEGKWYL